MERERTPDRSAKTSANRWYGELRMQNDATTLQALTCRYMPYTVFPLLFHFAHLLYWKTAMIKTISKCTTDTPKSTSRIVSMRRYALTFRALALRSSVDPIRDLSLYYYSVIQYKIWKTPHPRKYNLRILCKSAIRESLVPRKFKRIWYNLMQMSNTHTI